MTNEQFELLSAYADGELPEEDRRRAERLLETDAGAREAFEAIERAGRHVHQAYLPTYYEEPPARLMQALASPLTERRARFPGWLTLGSASGAAFSGLLLGWIGAASLQVAATESPVLVASADGLIAGKALAGFLDTAKSGNTATVAGQASVVTLSFRAADGRACRQFQTGTVMALGCKDSGEDWLIQATTQTAALSDGGYVPAAGGSPAVIEAAMSALGIADVYDASMEDAAIRDGWQ